MPATLSAIQYLELDAQLVAAGFSREYDPGVGPQVTYTGVAPDGREATLIVTDTFTSLSMKRDFDDERTEFGWSSSTPAAARDLRRNVANKLVILGFPMVARATAVI